MNRKGFFALIVLSALLYYPMATFAATFDVTVGNNFFSPSNVNIQVGDTVRWTNPADGGPPHNVTGNGYNSQTAESFVYMHTFTQAGVENYECTVHPGMTGTVTVQGGGGGGGGEADLSLVEISVNNNIVYAPGDQITIDTEVSNVGSATSTAYTVNYYLSTNAQISAGDTLLGSSNRTALGAGNDANFSVNVNLPGNLSSGDYYIGGIIDIDDASDANDTNLENEPISVQAGGGGGGGGFALNPGHNGNWWNGASRNGEGVQFELSDNGAGGYVLVATMYSYNPQGEQIFLLAVGQVVNGEADVTVYIYEGPVWGDGFDPANLSETEWGTGHFSSSSCDLIHMTLTPNQTYINLGYSILSYDLIRLTTPALPCPAP